MAGLSYNRREYANYGDYQVGGPGQAWDPFASYLNWTGKIGEPNWNPLALASEGTITQKAGYAAARLSLADPLKLIIGARYTDWKSEGEGADRAQGDHAVRRPGLRHQRDVLDLRQLHRNFPAADAEGPQWRLPRSGRWQELRSWRQGAWFDNRLNASLAVFRIEQDNVGQATGEPVLGARTSSPIALHAAPSAAASSSR